MNRAAAILARPDAWLEAAGGAYLLRVGPDRRRRPLLRLDEAAFADLAREPGLKPRGQGGYVLARQPAPAAAPAARPGVIEGERVAAEADGPDHPQRQSGRVPHRLAGPSP